MNAAEGIRRLVKTASLIAWLGLGCSLVAIIIELCQAYIRLETLELDLFLGSACFVIFQGSAWIVAGFTGVTAPNDGLIRWADVRKIWVKKKR